MAFVDDIHAVWKWFVLKAVSGHGGKENNEGCRMKHQDSSGHVKGPFILVALN